MNNIKDSSSSEEYVGYLFEIDGIRYTIPNLEEEIITLEEELYSAKNKIRNKENKLIRFKTILRVQLIKQIFDKFIKKQTENVQKAVYLNECLLRFVVKSYFDDIYRYKDYSGAKFANNHKQAAYTIKWIAKFKPVQIKEEFDMEQYLNNTIVDINLIFALVCGFSYLEEPYVKMIMRKNEKQNSDGSVTKQSFYDKLLYILRYRPFTGKQLISIFEALELNAPCK